MSHLPPYALTLFACVAVLGVHLSHAGPLLRLCSDSGSSQLEMRAWFFHIICSCLKAPMYAILSNLQDFRHDGAIADSRTLARDDLAGLGGR